MPSAKLFVFDTSALLALRQNEAGADTVQHILKSSGQPNKIYISFITLMEYFYVLTRMEGEAAAQEGYSALKQLPLSVIASSEQLGLVAARFKARASLSVADAWIAATSHQLQATLVHKDPEFEQLAAEISLKPLPYVSQSAKLSGLTAVNVASG